MPARVAYRNRVAAPLLAAQLGLSARAMSTTPSAIRGTQDIFGAEAEAWPGAPELS